MAKCIGLVLGLFCLVAALEGRHVETEERKECPDECKHKPLDISFIVDGSASIWRDNFTEGLWFMQRFVDRFHIGQDMVRVSVITFGNVVYSQDAIHFEDHEDKESLNEAIDSIPYRAGSYTATGEAIKWFMTHQQHDQRPDVRSVVIVLTDGNSQETEVTKAEAHKMVEAGQEVFAIGVGHLVSDEELHNIASDFDHVLRVDRYNMLDNIMDRLAFEACGVKPKGECEFDPADIAFVIDASRSIQQTNFTLGLEFIKQFIGNFEVSPKALRVAAIMFGKGVYPEHALHFDEYKNKKDTVDAILALPYMKGIQTDTSDGIEYMIENFLPNEREDAAHISIVITDGKSQRWHDTEKAAAHARELGITMFAVGIGRLGIELDEKELNSIAGSPDRVVMAEDYARLGAIREDLLHITCTGISENRKVKIEKRLSQS